MASLHLMQKKLLVVNKQDKVIGKYSREVCHLGKGKLHRAFSVFVVNKKGEILLQKRSKFKKLWPGFWSNACCSHFTEISNKKKQAEKRLREEMGFTCPLKFLFKLRYQARFKNIGSENEITYVFLGRYNGKVKPDPKEVAEYRWLDPTGLEREIREKPEIFAPWFREAMKKIKNL